MEAGNKTLSLLLSAALLGIFGCRKAGVDNVSHENSLDEVLGVTDANPRYCGAAGLNEAEKAAYRQQIDRFLKDSSGNPTELYISGGSDELREFTAETLLAIPPTMGVQVFNNNFQGQIVLSNADVRNVCEDLKETDGPTYGCAQKLPGEPLKIYLRESKAVIGVKLVQLFAQTMSRNITTSSTTRFSLTTDESVAQAINQFKAQLNLFVQMRQNLLAAFEADIAALQTETAIAFRNLSPDEKLHYVFAHTADSAYCSPESLASFDRMQKNGQFSNTFKTFFGLNEPSGKSLASILGKPWFK